MNKSLITKMSQNFRTKFILNTKVKNWFPGHMFKGIKQVNKRLHRIDCIVEIHDSRVPFTGRNTTFQKQLSETRPHYLILNKVDLCDNKTNDLIIKKIKEEEKIEKVIYTDLRTANEIKFLLPDILKMVRKSDRFQRSDKSEVNLMVTGIPNVGKSTFINRITNLYIKNKGTVAKQGSSPGVTRAVQEKIKVSSSPLVYIYDTPGILEPKFEDPIEDPLKLAACDLLPSQIIGKDVVADYILYWLNKNGYFNYVDVLKLDEPIDEINEFLVKVCINNNFFIKKRDLKSKELALKPDFELAINTFIKSFQTNKFGYFTLDIDRLMN